MSDKLELRRFGKGVKQAGKTKAKGYFAVMGKLDGTVLTGVGNRVYVTSLADGQAREVLNRRNVPNRAGLVVFVGSDEYSANRIEVLFELGSEGSSNNGVTSTNVSIPPHNHSWPGINTTWVHGQQFLPLLAKPIAGTLTIQIYPGVIRKVGSAGWAYIADQVIDVSGDVPASDALWITLQANDDGTVDYVVGATNVARASLDETDIPEATTGQAIWAVILEAGYNELFQNTSRNDFLDLRLDKSSGGLSDAMDITYTPAVLIDWDYASDPGDVADALDQLAARTTDLEVGGGGGLTQSLTSIAPTAANVTATVTDNINYHYADLSGLTADRNFVLPSASPGTKVVLNVQTGDDTYELVIIGNTGITIDGGSAATEWSRLFISGETIELLAISTAAWIVVHDGRIRSHALLTLSAADTTNTAAAATLPTWDNAPINVGDIADLTNYRVNIRRAGTYKVSGDYRANGNISDQHYVFLIVYLNGTGGTQVAVSDSRQSGTSTTASAAISSKSVICAVGDYLDFYYQPQDANMGISANKSFFEVIES